MAHLLVQKINFILFLSIFLILNFENAGFNSNARFNSSVLGVGYKVIHIFHVCKICRSSFLLIEEKRTKFYPQPLKRYWRFTKTPSAIRMH